MTGCSMIITTTNNEDTAHSLSVELVKSGIARCVQIDKVDSVYEWEGVIEKASEYRLFIKVADENIEAVKELIVKLHNYDLPEVIVLSIKDSTEEYIKWLKYQ